MALPRRLQAMLLGIRLRAPNQLTARCPLSERASRRRALTNKLVLKIHMLCQSVLGGEGWFGALLLPLAAVRRPGSL